MRNLLRKMSPELRPGDPHSRCCSSMPPTRASSSWCVQPWSAWASRCSALPTTCSQRLARNETAAPPATLGAAPLKEQVIHFINENTGGLPRNRRARCSTSKTRTTCQSRNPAATTAEAEAVFYFQGCRLGATVQPGGAGDAGMWHAGRCRRCCRRAICLRLPAARLRGSSARRKRSSPTACFHRVANSLNLLDIKTVVVGFGTCYDQLQGYKFEDIFPGCRIDRHP